MWRISALALAGLLGLTGCYSYVPAERPAPAPGSRIHAHLTPTGAEATFGASFGRHVGAVRGQVLEASDSIVLALDGIWQPNGAELSWPDRFIALPADAIAAYREQRISWWRTAVFTAALVAVPAALDKILGAGIVFPTDEENDSDGPDNTR